MYLGKDVFKNFLFAKGKQPSLSFLHEENYRMLELLMPRKYECSCEYISLIKNHPILQLVIQQKHTYTTDISFEYQFENSDSDQIAIRIYHDAHVAELLYSTEFERQLRILGPNISSQLHAKTRTKQNIFLHKWLIYLLDVGYGVNQWRLTLN